MADEKKSDDDLLKEFFQELSAVERDNEVVRCEEKLSSSGFARTMLPLVQEEAAYELSFAKLISRQAHLT